jgi:DNA-binding transcriptional ArsR family regulator
VESVLRALSDPRRREILRLVSEQERSAGEIASNFDITRPAISQHLGVLKGAGLVSERRDGTRRLYRARQDEMRKLRDFLDDYWTSGLERLRDAAEAAQRQKEGSDGRARP